MLSRGSVDSVDVGDWSRSRVPDDAWRWWKVLVWWSVAGLLHLYVFFSIKLVSAGINESLRGLLNYIVFFFNAESWAARERHHWEGAWTSHSHGKVTCTLTGVDLIAFSCTCFLVSLVSISRRGEKIGMENINVVSKYLIKCFMKTTTRLTTGTLTHFLTKHNTHDTAEKKQHLWQNVTILSRILKIWFDN